VCRVLECAADLVEPPVCRRRTTREHDLAALELANLVRVDREAHQRVERLRRAECVRKPFAWTDCMHHSWAEHGRSNTAAMMQPVTAELYAELERARHHARDGEHASISVLVDPGHDAGPDYPSIETVPKQLQGVWSMARHFCPLFHQRAQW